MVIALRRASIRQFVAMQLGSGYSVEEQLTGDAEHGGLQMVAYPMKADRYAELARKIHQPGRSTRFGSDRP